MLGRNVCQKCQKGLGRLLGQDDRVDVGKNSTLGDGDSSKQSVKLLIVPDSELEVTGNDPLLLVVPGSVPSQLEDLGGQVFHHSGHVDGGAGAHPLSVVTFPEEFA